MRVKLFGLLFLEWLLDIEQYKIDGIEGVCV
jgi:hypothetical protein